jgi:glycosyltransferase involved in cell wall biosynthesis
MRLAVDLAVLRGSPHDPAREHALVLLRGLADTSGSDELVAVLPDPRDAETGLVALAEVRAVLPARDVLVCPPVPFVPDGAGPVRRRAAAQAVAASCGAAALAVPEPGRAAFAPGAATRDLLPVCTVLRPTGGPAPADRAAALTGVGEVVGAAGGDPDVAARARALPPVVAPERTTLAVVSPWPPVRSGVADYAASTLPALAEHYAVTVVDDVPLDGWPVVSRADFRDRWWEFDRVLYHLGNSIHHSRDLDLMAQAPGVVVVHDAVLSGALHGAGTGFGHPHGSVGLVADDGPPPPEDALDLRGSRAVLAPALGLVLHSTHALALLREGGVTTGCTGVTRLAVVERPPAPAHQRVEGDPLVLGHFGFVNPFKGADLLVQAAGRMVAQGRPAEVVLVGDVSSEGLQARLERQATDLRVPLRITGFVDDVAWEEWLGRVDCAVQLRPRSHGESSAALGQLLAAGVPVLCTDGGSFAELPHDVVRHVPPDAGPDRIAAELLDLVLGGAAALRERAVAWSREECSPRRWAADIAATVERAYAGSLARAWAESAVGLDGLPVDGALFELPGGGERRDIPWASDVSVYAGTDFFSGIQRVTSRLHRELGGLLAAGHGSLQPTFITEGLPGPQHPDLGKDPMSWRPAVPVTEAEWLLCLDLNVRLARHRAQLQTARSRGLRILACVYDIIPVRHPEWFPREAGDVGFAAWLGCMLVVADVLVVNSAATAADLRAYVDERPPDRPDPLRVATVPLGWDLGVAHPQPHSAPRDADHFLMVGTVEPRKGHDQVLDAFERMWADGLSARLTVVGRRGWLVDGLAQRMSGLDRSEPRFRWLESAGDAELDELYGRCTAVVMASRAEGFGLPVVEAGLRGCPVVLRDIPVLREVASDTAIYVRPDGSDLVEVLTEVVRRAAQGPLPAGQAEHVRTWREVAEDVVGLLTDRLTADDVWSPFDRDWRHS